MCQSAEQGGRRCAAGARRAVAAARARYEQSVAVEQEAWRAAQAEPALPSGNVVALRPGQDAHQGWRAADENRYAAYNALVRAHAELARTPAGRAELAARLDAARRSGTDPGDDGVGGLDYLEQVEEARDDLEAFSSAAREPRPSGAGLQHVESSTGESFAVAAMDGARQVGELRYRVEDGQVVVAWVEVDPDRRGRGVAQGMLERVAQGRPVRTESTTEQGRAWVAGLWARAGIDVAVDDEDEG